MAATKLLVIGDQVAASLSGPFVEVAKKNGFEVRVDARPGTTAADWIKNGWLAADIDTIDPDGVFIVLGGNDARGDVAGLGDAAKVLVAQGEAKKATVGWIAPLTGSDPGLPAVRKALADAMGDKLFPTDRWGYARAQQRADCARRTDVRATGRFRPSMNKSRSGSSLPILRRVHI